jgi:glycerol uptake facilitator-like aquaporin
MHEEERPPPIGRAAFGELLGTFFLVFVAAGAEVVAALSRGTNDPVDRLRGDGADLHDR